MAKHDAINDIVRNYKSGSISHDECFRYIASAFQPLFWRKKATMAQVNTDHTWIGDFWDVYLNCIELSLENFSFDYHHGAGRNNLSFTPYFQNLFNLKCDSYKKVIYKVIEEKKNNLSLEDMLANSSFSISKNKDIFDYIQHYDDAHQNEKDFEEFLKREVLTAKEYKIFFMKMKGKNNTYIGSKMKRVVSAESIRREWNNIAQKIHVHVNKRKNDQ